MAGKMYINHESFDSWASTIDSANNELLNKLKEIESTINNLEGDWESDSGRRIREKITGMEPRFEQYYEVVENYAIFLRNTAADYKATEASNTSNADQFI